MSNTTFTATGITSAKSRFNRCLYLGLAVFGISVVSAAIHPAETEAESGTIRIIRTKVVEKKDGLINAAYRAYQSGDLVAAKVGYAEVLQAYPDNRDAMLGLAACAVKAGDVEAAVTLYSRLIRVYPQDALPRAALIGLQRKLGGRQAETVIRELLFDQPDNPFLHFTLGQIRAEQSRWPEAKQAFFEAHRIDSANPVYALNLAISLDRMGQGETALDYYLTVVELAEQSASDLDIGPVIRRINSLFRPVQP